MHTTTVSTDATSHVLGPPASIMGSELSVYFSLVLRFAALPRPDALSPLQASAVVLAHNTRRYEHPLAGGPGPIGVAGCAIHPTTQLKNSAKFVCRIMHSPGPIGPKTPLPTLASGRYYLRLDAYADSRMLEPGLGLCWPRCDLDLTSPRRARIHNVVLLPFQLFAAPLVCVVQHRICR